jgi:hypothetical protein
MTLAKALQIPPDRLREFRELSETWRNGNRKDVRDALLANREDLTWPMMFAPFFVHRFGWAEYGILVRLVALGND